MLYYAIFALLLLAGAYCAMMMSIADLRRRIIPDVYSYPFLLIGLVLVTCYPWICTPAESAFAAVFSYGLALGVGMYFDRSLQKKDKGYKHPPIGLGDVKLLAAGGIWLGPVGLGIAIMISFLTGCIWGIINKQKYIPFAPFFFAGTIIALLVMFFLI